MTRRVVKKLITMFTIFPIHYDTLCSRVSRFMVRTFPTKPKFFGLLCILFVSTYALFRNGNYFLACLFAITAAVLVVPKFFNYLREYFSIRLISPNANTLSSLLSAKETLLKMGIGRSVVERILSKADAKTETCLAEMDQNNRVLSCVGHIPVFEESIIEQNEFRQRSRNRVQLVVIDDLVCVKKSYRNFNSFCRECLALAALERIKGVPKIVKINRRERILYQSFLAGKNLGSLMVENGASVSIQHLVSVKYPGVGNWSEFSGIPSERKLAVSILSKTVDEQIILSLARLYEKIHNNGVAVKDLKYGNIIICDDAPFLCDFDLARVFRRNNTRFIMEREKDRDLFNFFFGEKLIIEQRLREEVDSLTKAKKNVLYAPVYYGKGYNVGKIGSIEFGSGKWSFIKKYLPDLQGKKILDLGCNNGVISLEMLRAGALSVTGYEPNSHFAHFAKLNHQWLEFVDNRQYDFELVNGYMNEVCNFDLTGYDIATAFCSLYYEPVENMRKIIAFLSERVDIFILQCNENAEEHSGDLLAYSSVSFNLDLLTQCGFPHQHVIRFRYYDRPLIIAS